VLELPHNNKSEKKFTKEVLKHGENTSHILVVHLVT